MTSPFDHDSTAVIEKRMVSATWRSVKTDSLRLSNGLYEALRDNAWLVVSDYVRHSAPVDD
jgi:hypothetical protein